MDMLWKLKDRKKKRKREIPVSDDGRRKRQSGKSRRTMEAKGVSR